MNKKDQQIRDTYFSRLKEIEKYEAEIARKGEGVPEWMKRFDTSYAEGRIRELKKQIAATEKAGLPQTDMEKRGKKRKTYERVVGDTAAEKKILRRIRRKFPDIFKPPTDFTEPSIVERELEAGFDYEDELKFLNRDIGQAHQDKDVERLRVLKKERKDLTRRYPLAWRTWLNRPTMGYTPLIPETSQALKDALAYLDKHRWPLQKHKDKFWGKRLPDETFDRNLGIDPDVVAAGAQKLLAALLSAMRKQRASCMLRKNITVIEQGALRRLYESLGVSGASA